MTETTAKPSRPVVFLPIEPAAQLTKCRYCPKMIYFSAHPTTGKPHPIAIDTHASSYAPKPPAWGQGVTHYADCPGAARARLDAEKKRAATALAEVSSVETSELACIHCGCTDSNACPGGCSWVSTDPPVCSSCVFSDTPALT